MFIIMFAQRLQESIDKYGNEILTIIYSLFVYFEIDANIGKILLTLMLIDTVLGIMKSAKLNVRFSGKRLATGFISKLSVLLIPMTITTLGKGLQYDFTWFVDVVLDILIVSEGISIFGNMASMRTGKEVKTTDIITTLINACRAYLIKLADSMLQSTKNKLENDKD